MAKRSPAPRRDAAPNNTVSTVQVDASMGSMVLGLWLKNQAGPLNAYTGKETGAALLTALFSAEQLAEQAGLASRSGEGTLILGGAKARIGEAPEDVRTLYLATYAAVQRTHDSVAPSISGLGSGLGGIGVWPVGVWVLLGIALASSIAGGTYYATETSKTKVIIDGQSAQQAAAAAAASQVAKEALAKGQPIPPELWQAFKPLAAIEGSSPILYVGAAVAGALLLYMLMGD